MALSTKIFLMKMILVFGLSLQKRLNLILKLLQPELVTLLKNPKISKNLLVWPSPPPFGAHYYYRAYRLRIITAQNVDRKSRDG